DGRLKRVDIDGSSLQTLANTTRPVGGSWNREGVILYPLGDGLWRIRASGGEPIQVTRVEGEQTQHLVPHFLPDGRHFLYLAVGRQSGGIYVGDLERKETRRLLETDSTAVYDTRGYLLFVNQGTLFAQALDLGQIALRGAPFPIAADLGFGATITRMAAFSSA